MRLGFGIVVLSGVFASVAMGIDFDRDVRPILSDKCFHCHGPDAEERKGKLRLDTREGALQKRKDGRAAIVPGDPETSELVHRMISKDPDEMMPPPDSNRSLSREEMRILARWIAAGAEWSEHWAFEAPKAVTINKGEASRGVMTLMSLWKKRPRRRD